MSGFSIYIWSLIVSLAVRYDMLALQWHCITPHSSNNAIRGSLDLYLDKYILPVMAMPRPSDCPVNALPASSLFFPFYYNVSITQNYLNVVP
jgi:hypothetical protein